MANRADFDPPNDVVQALQRDPGPSPRLIRRFSDDLERQGNGEALSQGLMTKVSSDRCREERAENLHREWMLLLADADHLSQIAVQDEEKHMLETSRALAKAWERFQKTLPAGQQENLQGSSPSLSSLFTCVRNAEKTWRQKRDHQKWAKIKQSFARISQFGDDHSQLLQIVPSNDKYISLITGSLSAIVKASVNHENLADALSDSLNELCEDVAHWKKQILAHPRVPEMQAFIRDLYVVIFEFLTDIFQAWSSSSLKRLAASFDRNAAEKLFRSKRIKIDRLTTELDRAARLDTEQKINRLNDSLNHLDQVVTKADLDQFRLQLGSDVQRLLQEKYPWNHAASVPDSQKLISAATSTDGAIEEAEQHGSDDHEDLGTTQGFDYAAAIPRAFYFHQDEEIQRLFDSMTHLQVDRMVVGKLRTWIHGETHAQLWIHGPAHVPKPSQNTLTAIAVVGLANNANITVLYHFVTLRGSLSSSNIRSDLRRMCQSLLSQVVMLLPVNIPLHTGTSAALVGSCFEDKASVSKILDTYHLLLKLIPKPILCILDGVEALENRSDLERTKELANALTRLSTEPCNEPKSDFKLCVTTDGYVDLLSTLRERGIFESVKYELESDERGANDAVALDSLDEFERY